MKAKKIVSLVLIGAFVLTSIIGCSSPKEEAIVQQSSEEQSSVEQSSEEEVTLTYWHTYSGESEEVFKNAISSFEAENPNIKIDPIVMPVDGLEEQIIAATAGGVSPDLMGIDLVSVVQFADMGAFEEISGYEGFNEIKENLISGTIDTSSYKDGYYGLPLHRSVTTPVWNMDMLNEWGITTPPSTIDELISLAREHSDPENEQWMFTIEGTYTWGMLPWFWSLGGQIADENYTISTGYLNSDESVEALETIASWYKEGIMGPAILGEEPAAWGGSLGGNYAMCSIGPWFYTSADCEHKTQTTTMPKGTGGSVSIQGGQDIVMFKNSKNKEAAWKFMKYMLNDEVQSAFGYTGLFPATKTAKEDIDTTNTPWLSAYLEQLENAKPRIPSANWGEMETILGQTFEQVIRGEADAKAALDEASEKMDALF